MADETPEQAKERIVEREADADFMKRYVNRHHPEHENAAAEMGRLYQRAYPD